MRNDAYPDAFLRDILAAVKTIAVVGASNRKKWPSYGVFAYLLARGYQVIGVNPSLAGKSVHGAAFFKTLADVPEPIDMVDIFRNSADAAAPVADAIRLGAKTAWMQLGVVNEQAAAAARAAGLNVVMDHCPAIEIPRLGLDNKRMD